MKYRLLTTVAACALACMAHAQNSSSSSGAISGSNSSGNSTNNTNNSNPTSNSNSGSVSGSTSISRGGTGGAGGTGGTANGNVSNNANSSNSSARTSSASTANNAGNNQSNGSSSISGGGSATASGGQGGQGGIGVGGQGGSAGINANISPSTSITFTGPPVSTSNIKTTGETTQNLNQSYTGRTEQVLSGETYQYIDYGGTQTIKNVPNVNAPPLTSSNDTCMGSVSGGVAVAGLGLTGGSTYTDEHCKRIKMSRELWNKGMKAASLAMDCMDPAAREALEITGFTCPQTTRAQQRAAAAGSPVATTGASQHVAVRGAARPDPSREQPGYAEPSPVTTQVAEAGALRSTPTRQPDDSVTVRRVDLPLDRRQP